MLWTLFGFVLCLNSLYAQKRKTGNIELLYKRKKGSRKKGVNKDIRICIKQQEVNKEIITANLRYSKSIKLRPFIYLYRKMEINKTIMINKIFNELLYFKKPYERSMKLECCKNIVEGTIKSNIIEKIRKMDEEN